MKIYSTFLSNMKDRGNYWHALPHSVAQWWRDRAVNTNFDNLEKGAIASVAIVNGNILIDS